MNKRLVHHIFYELRHNWKILFFQWDLDAFLSHNASELGLDKICLAKFEQNGQPKERSNSASKMGCQFCQKSKMGKNEL